MVFEDDQPLFHVSLRTHVSCVAGTQEWRQVHDERVCWKHNRWSCWLCRQSLLSATFPVRLLVRESCSELSLAWTYSQRADLTSVFGAATVGLLSNAWTKAFNGPSFLVALPGIMFQLPSGLSNGGLLSFATTQAAEDVTVAFGNLFSVVEQLLIVALGLVVGLFTSSGCHWY